MSFKFHSAILLLAMVCIATGCSEANKVETFKTSTAIVPKPQSVELISENPIVVEGISIKTSAKLDALRQQLSEFLAKRTTVSTGMEKAASVIFQLKTDAEHDLGEEGYTLETHENEIVISSPTELGLYRGLVSLKQLLLLNEADGKYILPQIKITDSPTFGHRGLLLDCSRHFFEVEVVKKYLDLLALYKMNTLHWHLTEDQGWRIAIDKYPRLTEIGAYRTEADGSTYGGLYTKDEIREVLAYAEERHVEVIPEIEMPGHSQAAIAAYPQLSCTQDTVAVANDWGVFKEIYCAGDDSVFTFLEDVLTEVMALFPSGKIHIGGDEAPKTRWESCSKCQKRIRDENLADEHELQSYFIKRIQSFLTANGKELIGWDEILEGGLSDGAIVQSWRGMDGGIEAVKHGNRAIMSPTSHAYLDYGLGAIDMKKVYSFNPVPHGLGASEQKQIMGGECNIWTEHVPDEKTLDSKVFPRLLAMAEVLWSDSSQKNYSDFRDRVQSHYSILKSFGVEYGKESVALTNEMILSGRKAYLKLVPYSDDIDLEYVYNCNACNGQTQSYSTPIKINGSGEISIQPKRSGDEYGEPITVPVAAHEAINAEVVYHSDYSQWYTAGGAKGLVDGKLGTLNFRDGSWQGFWGSDLKCTVGLPEPVEALSVSANFYQYNNSWIFIPSEMTVEVSPDGKNWKSWETVQSGTDTKQRGKFIRTLEANAPIEEQVSYIRLTAKNLGKVPAWHEAAGSDAWIFIDEIVVE